MTNETNEKAPEEQMFLLRNATRSRLNRTLRAQQPVHHRLKQYACAGKYRIIRGRPVQIPMSELQKHFEEIQAKVTSGVFDLCTLDGRLVDIESGRPVVEHMVSAPLPNPPMDSIANDKQNVGQAMPQFPGGDFEGMERDVPELVASATMPEEPELFLDVSTSPMDEVPALIESTPVIPESPQEEPKKDSGKAAKKEKNK